MKTFCPPQGQLVQMACSRLGSRVLEAVWSSASISQRQSIAQELGNLDGFSSLIVKIPDYRLRCDSVSCVCPLLQLRVKAS